jgi:hypothetical protein
MPAHAYACAITRRRTRLTPCPHCASQTLADIVATLSSLKNLKGVRISVKKELFGIEWARAKPNEPDNFMGTILRSRAREGDRA